MFIKKEDMKASMAVYMDMIKDGHIEGVKVKEIFTIPLMITKCMTVHQWEVRNGVPVIVGVAKEFKVPNTNCERELIGYNVTIIKREPREFQMAEGCVMKTNDLLKAYLYAKTMMPNLVQKHLH